MSHRTPRPTLIVREDAVRSSGRRQARRAGAAALGLAATLTLAAAASPLLAGASSSLAPSNSGLSSRSGPGSLPAAALVGVAASEASIDVDEPRRPNPIPVDLRGAPTLEVMATPVAVRRAVPVPPTDPASDSEGDCPPVTVTHSGADFSGGSYIAQAGFVDNEVAAASYTIDASEFPIKLDLAEMIFVTSNATVSTTTDWSLIVWEGTPATGTIVAEFSSDGVILPPIQLPPGTTGVNVQVLVDPGDPDQIIIGNDGSATFSVGYRIDAHNQPPGLPCFFGPDACCNAFPATDTDGLAEPSRNWLRGINCGSFGCPPNGGWANFAQLPELCRPSGDWVIRATWSSLSCSGGSGGACCLPDGTCEILQPAACAEANGEYQGDGVLCGQVTCPDPIGACCFENDCLVTTERDCGLIGGVFLGVGTDCSSPDVCNPDGACCIPGTMGCLTLSEADCALVGGIFQGAFTRCGEIVCFPEGACCLPDGQCVDGLSPEDCITLGGTFQGDGSDCGTVDCPEPTGACCLQDGAVCLVLTEADCATVAGTWIGAGTDCRDGDGDGSADACGSCPADFDGSGAIDFPDLLQVLSAWGTCPGCPEDLDESGAVDFADLLSVLSAFGPC